LKPLGIIIYINNFYLEIDTFYLLRAQNLDLPGDAALKIFLQGLATVNAHRKRSGDMVDESRDTLTPKAYRYICKLLHLDLKPNPQVGYFFKLMWNIIARADASRDSNGKNYFADGITIINI